MSRPGKPRRTPPKNPSAEFFSALPAEDFFSDRVQHLYLYDTVDNESVHQLQQDIHDSNQSINVNGVQMSPKPIVLHVNSPGGSTTACMSMLTIFNQTRVPLCTMTDGMSGSAASYLTIASPYRVAASPHVLTLIHQGSLGASGTTEQMKAMMTLLDMIDGSLEAIYLACTKLKLAQLREIMLRDMFLDTEFCTRYGIYDRVLDVNNGPGLATYRKQRAEYLDLPMHVLLSKSNWNRFVFSTCQGDVQRLDTILSTPPEETKPIIYYCTPRCQDHSPYYWLAMLARMKAMRVPVYSVIESIVSIWEYIPSLFCMKRYMYSHGIIDIDLQYDNGYGLRLQDIRDNTNIMLRILQTILRQKTSIPDHILKDLGEKRHTFTAAQCLQYGLCDEVVQLNHQR